MYNFLERKQKRQDFLPFRSVVLSPVSLYCRRHWFRRKRYGKTRAKGIAIEWLPQTESASNQAIVATYKDFKNHSFIV